MKRISITMLALVLAAGLVTVLDADAGVFKKDKPQRTERPDWMKKPHYYDNMPVMSFHSGELQQDGRIGWKLGELKLQLAKDCLITTDGVEAGFLDAGRHAIVMGPKVGDTVVAWSVQISRPDYAMQRNDDSRLRVKKSAANSNCGEIVSGPE